MEKLSLYINHQLVSHLIKDLENVVDVCYQELDEEYQTYELRTPIYEQFIFQISKLYRQSAAELKYEDGQIKNEQGEVLKDQIQAKEELVKMQADQEGPNTQNIPHIRLGKGRPVKHWQAENQLASWLKNEFEKGKQKFLKTKIDDYYKALLPISQRKKPLPMNNTLRLLKKYNLSNIIVVARNGAQKSVENLVQIPKRIDKNQKKSDDQSFIVKDQYISQNEAREAFYVEHYDDEQKNQQIEQEEYFVPQKNMNLKEKIKRNLRNNKSKNIKENKENKEKSEVRFIDDSNQQVCRNLKFSQGLIEVNSNHQDSETPWQKMLNYQNQSETEMRKIEIYQNSKSFLHEEPQDQDELLSEEQIS